VGEVAEGAKAAVGEVAPVTAVAEVAVAEVAVAVELRGALVAEPERARATVAEVEGETLQVETAVAGE
jgi:hypothetical protein